MLTRTEIIHRENDLRADAAHFRREAEVIGDLSPTLRGRLLRKARLADERAMNVEIDAFLSVEGWRLPR
jgi:hypothetical protein